MRPDSYWTHIIDASIQALSPRPPPHPPQQPAGLVLSVSRQQKSDRGTEGKVILTLQLSLLWLKSIGPTSLRVTKGSNKHPWDKYIELKAKIIGGVNALLSTNFKFSKTVIKVERPLKIPLIVQKPAEDTVKVSTQQCCFQVWDLSPC